MKVRIQYKEEVQRFGEFKRTFIHKINSKFVIMELCSKVNEGLEDELCIFGFEVVPWRTLALNLCILLTAGLLWLPLYWVPKWKLLLTHKRVPLDKATSVLVEVQNHRNWADGAEGEIKLF